MPPLPCWAPPRRGTVTEAGKTLNVLGGNSANGIVSGPGAIVLAGAGK